MDEAEALADSDELVGYAVGCPGNSSWSCVGGGGGPPAAAAVVVVPEA
jgi:hypothetical protein